MYDDLATGLNKLETRARIAKGLIYAFIAAFGVMTAIFLALFAGLIDPVTNQQYADAVAIVAGGAILIYLLSAIAVGMWIHRAHANLFSAGLDGLEFTPGWSVGWFFVPIMSLFRPFQAMRELWNRSLGEPDSYSAATPQQIGIWWGAYLAGSFFGNFGDVDPVAGSSAGLLVGCLGNGVLIVSAIYLKQIIDTVGSAQRSMMGIAETFA